MKRHKVRGGYLVHGDCLEVMRGMRADSVDLCFGSPPYTDARLYLENGEKTGIARKTEEWAAWMVEVFTEARRVCKGLVAMVVAGNTNDRRWNAAPALLMADLHRAGFNLRNPPIFHRVGIPGSGGAARDHGENGGGPDWLRADTEFVVCTSRPGKLPWADGTACGHPPRWAPGGEMSYRLTDGTRVNQWGRTSKSFSGRRPDGSFKKSGRPSHRLRTKGGSPKDTCRGQPVIANPGNLISLNVGGGQMGSDLAHNNEAPFPLSLAEFFVKSFCRPGGIVLDPFGGSGTTAAAAIKNGRRFVSCDIRASQVELQRRRVDEAWRRKGFLP